MKRLKDPRLITLCFVAVCGIVVGGWFVWYSLSLRPVSSSQSVQEFIVEHGQKAKDIAANLESKGLIRSHAAFLLFVDLHGLRPRLQAGTYQLKPAYSTPEIVDIMAGGKVASNRLTIPEGSTIAQIRDLAAAKGIKTQDFNSALAGSYTFDFLKSKPATVDLEGYLFPDSYDVNSTTTAQSLIKSMLQNFELKVTPDVEAAFKAEGLTLHQGVTLASIIEKEVPGTQDRAIVAGIFLKRLAAGQALESDVTVDYAAQQLHTSFSTTLNSPYNTYANKGLPPGPIDNPGLDAINAAAHPKTSDYLYFLAGKDGVTHYARTFAEHQQNVQKYLQ